MLHAHYLQVQPGSLPASQHDNYRLVMLRWQGQPLHWALVSVAMEVSVSNVQVELYRQHVQCTQLLQMNKCTVRKHLESVFNIS